MGKFKFSYDYCKSEVEKLTYYSELQGTSLYNALLKHPDWLKELTKDLIKSNMKPSGTYTYEYCKAEVQKLRYYKELQGTTLYRKLQDNGWLELAKDLIRLQQSPGYWNDFEKVHDEALKYNTRTEFEKGSPSAYCSATRNEWLNDVCSHMTYIQLPNGYWKENEEKLLESAKKYKTQKEWLENDPKLFRAATKLPIFEECVKHMEYIFKPNGWWTYDRCKEALLRYETITEILKSNDKQAYIRAYNNGWNELYSHFTLLQRPKGHYTLEFCKVESLKYNSRSEIAKNDSGLYAQILKNNWDDICFSHMKRKMTLKERHIYAFEFPDNHVYVGLTCQIERRMNVHLGLEDYKRRFKSPVYSYLNETGLTPVFKQLTDKPIPESESPDNEKFYMNQYKLNGWVLLNKAKAGSLGSMQLKWTDDYVKDIASKCTLREEFSKQIPANVRKRLRDEGKWNDIISHMKKSKRLNGEWNYEDCIKAMKSCETRGEFQQKYSGAHKYAIRHNLLEGNLPTREEALRNKKKIFEDFEICKQEALKFTTRKEFHKNSSNYYCAAKRIGILDEICKHMKVIHTKKISSETLLENICETASSFKTRWEWGKNYPREYSMALKRNWIDIACAHMIPTTNQQLNPNIYTLEVCLLEAKKYEYITQFMNKSKYHYLTAKKMGWLDITCAHMIKNITIKWVNKEIVVNEASKYKNRSEFQDKCSGGFKAAKRMGCLDELFS